ncbi:MAG: hypothetical protein GWP06_00215 [Actinobacteria bacterium]|nr:hypothetical protein [Actinomycetota bacterium]
MGFHNGNKDGNHYWLTPPNLMQEIATEFKIDFDPCPNPLPDDFDGLTCEWGKSSYCNPPFGSIIHEGKKKGPTAWARKAIKEYEKGKKVVLVYPIAKWIHMLLKVASEVRNLGDVKWCATEDGSTGPGIGQHVACFILDPGQNDSIIEKAEQLVRGAKFSTSGDKRVAKTLIIKALKNQ